MFNSVISGLVGMGIWEIGRRLFPKIVNKIKTRKALKKLFTMDGETFTSLSVVKSSSGKINHRKSDTLIIFDLNLPAGNNHKVNSEYTFRSPNKNLVAIGSTRRNVYAEMIQKEFNLPFQFIAAKNSHDPDKAELRIITKYGDELISSRDQRPLEEMDVDYGILFVAKLENNKKVIWISGIHGHGSLGVYNYLNENAKEILNSFNDLEKGEGNAYLIRVVYKFQEEEELDDIIKSELIGDMIKCSLKDSESNNKALIFDLGNVLFDFDRTRTYRQISDIIKRPFKDVQKVIEKSDIRDRYESGKLNNDEFLDEILLQLGKLGGNINLLDKDRLYQYWADIFTPNVPMLNTLKNLKTQKIPLILLSNTNQIHFDHIKMHYPEIISLFDDIILSYKVGFIKPDPLIFNEAKKIINSKFDQNESVKLLFVDDISEYIDEAAKNGIDGFVYYSYSHFIFWLRTKGIYLP